ncbi:MAG: carbon-nitrogen hydrolase family protein [Phascolarctobacterium sp.]|nr:carbon-nitrogen hydrolase family protein [Phascolarctobacterium sp.]
MKLKSLKIKSLLLLGMLLLILGSSSCFATELSKTEGSVPNQKVASEIGKELSKTGGSVLNQKELSKTEGSVLNQKVASENERELVKGKGSNVMKIALCHLDVSCGPQEKNLEKISRALQIAGEGGARLVVTPETAVQGYYFHRIDEERKLEVQPAPYLDGLRNLVKQYGVYLFLGCGEYAEETGLHHNTCFVFAPDGSLQSRHRKIYGEKLGAEKWASPGAGMSTTNCDGVDIGVLVCADSWFDERPLSLKEQGADLLIDIAAWPETPETGNPLPSWKKVTKITGLPFILCNQTGKPKWMDMSIGESVAIENELVKCKYSGAEAVLFLEFDTAAKKILSSEFEVVPFK